jgi:drug/metabolite transporter (DMT)-like permease
MLAGAATICAVNGMAGGLTTAAAWACAGTCSARTSRSIGPLATVATGNVVGVVATIAFALVAVGRPDVGGAGDVLAALGYAFGTMSGLLLIFRGYSIGKVSLVSAMVSTNGTVAALFSVLVLGEYLPSAAVAAMVVTGLGVALTALRPDPPVPGRSDRAGIVFGLLGAAAFAGAILSGDHAGSLDPLWVVATGRVVGLIAITLPYLVLRGVPRVPRPVLPFAIGSPLFDATGFAALLIAGENGIAVPAALSTLNVPLLVVLGAVVFRERPRPMQLLGILITVTGVAALALTR